MFWRFGGGYSTQSAVDILLDKGDFTLEDLLDEEDLLQECKTNKKLKDFLCLSDTLEALLLYIIEPPADELAESLKYKYPNLACEVVCCESPVVTDHLMQNEALLSDFWRYLEVEPPLNPLQGSFFAKVIGMLLQRNPSEALYFIQSQENPIENLLRHFETSAIMDLLLKIVGAEEMKDSDSIVEWLDEQNLIPRLAELLAHDDNAVIHQNAAQALIDIMNMTHPSELRNPLIEKLKSPEVIKQIMEYVLKEDHPLHTSVVINALSVLIELIQRSLGIFFHHELASEMQVAQEDLSDLVASVLPFIPSVHALLFSHQSQVEYSTSHGQMVPFGTKRLKILEFFGALLHINSNNDVSKAFVEHNILPAYIELFFTYQWNNFLHSLVHDMLIKVFSAELPDTEALLESILVQGRLAEKIVEASQANQAELEEPRGIRRGYMGHITLIASELSRVMDRTNVSEECRKRLTSESWTEYHKSILTETLHRDNKPLGGSRPPTHGPESEEDDLFESALNDADTGPDQFARFLCHQMTADLPDKFNGDEEDDYSMDKVMEGEFGHGRIDTSAYDNPFDAKNQYDDSDDEAAEDDDDDDALAEFPGYQTSKNISIEQAEKPGEEGENKKEESKEEEDKDEKKEETVEAVAETTEKETESMEVKTEEKQADDTEESKSQSEGTVDGNEENP
eukprot:Lithocolla_globosa_v1_NODE_2035_length_2198_cov_21.818479.p1 type:complete len:682 gc:universal NODE_2035_length_2198_cov_21.818479:147-2192(+)